MRVPFLAVILLVLTAAIAGVSPAFAAEAGPAPRARPGATTAPSKKTTTVEVPKVEVTASEGSTATAIRGKPPRRASRTTRTAPPATEPSAGAQTQTVNPDVIALQNSADLIVKDIAFTGLGEIVFKLVNRGKIAINMPVRQSAGMRLAPRAPSGPPISIDVWIGSSKIMSVNQPSMGGSQTKEFKVAIPSNYPKPECLATRDLKIVVDPQNQVQELYDDNNVTAAPNSARPCPDLAIKSIKRAYSGLFDETYQPKVTVINLGNAPSPSIQVWGTSLPGGIWPVTGWPELAPTHTIPALDPGETTSFGVGGSVLSANHTAIRILLDRYFQIEESDEGNNFQDKRL